MRVSPMDDKEKKSRSQPSLKQIWPDVWALLKPRRRMLAVGLVLIAINRAAGLVLPA